MLKVLIAGGGTGGHINPGIAIAKKIKQHNTDAKIIFAGTSRGLETELVPKEGFELKLIRVKGFRRKLSLDTLVSVKELFLGFIEARKLIKSFRPDVVIGTGGYVCGPVLLNAALIGIPTMIHEQNAYPGVTNKLLSRFVNAVAISFKESEKYFKSARKVILTGNPIRGEVLLADRRKSRKTLGINPDRPLVSIVGGSLGAEKINNVVCAMLKKYNKEISFNIMFATGKKQYDKVMKLVGGLDIPLFKVVPYIYNAGEVYSASDLMICRAGAIICSELTAIGLPSVMIPSPNVTENHQEFNARSLEKNGAAKVVLEKDLDEDLLYKIINELLFDRNILAEMRKKAKEMGITDAADKIYAMLYELTPALRT